MQVLDYRSDLMMCVAITGIDYCVIAADKPLSTGYSIYNHDHSKICNIVIRWTQWERVFTADGVDLVARIERVEQEVRSLGVVVRALSLQLEKLAIRFRVTRRALKELIAERSTC